MFEGSIQELLVIGLVALLVFGPNKLPEMGRMLAKALREFRRASDEFRSTIESSLHLNDLEPVIQPPASVAAEPPAAVAGGADVQTAAGAPAEVTTITEASTADGESAEPLCAQRGSRLFHRRDCTWVARIPELERIYLKRVTDAHEQGFVECPVCAPWEPA